MIGMEEAQLLGRGRQDEGEFAGLGEAEGCRNGRVEGVALHEHGGHGNDGLEENEGRDEPQDKAGVGRNEADVEQHAHGDEEEAHEDVPVGQYVGDDAHGVLGAGKHEAREEGSEGGGHAEGRGQPGKAEADDEGGEQEHLAGAGSDHGVHETVEEKAGKENHAKAQACHLGSREQALLPGELDRAGEQGDHDHHGRHHDVLEDEDGEPESSHGRGGHALGLEDLQDDGRGGKGHEHAPEHALLGLADEEPSSPAEKDDEADLEAAAEKDRPLEAVQGIAGKLHADGEHEHGDAEVGHVFDGLFVADEAEHRGAAEHAGEQEAHGGRQLEAAAGEVDQNGEQKEDNDFVEELVSHGLSSRSVSGYHRQSCQ